MLLSGYVIKTKFISHKYYSNGSLNQTSQLVFTVTNYELVAKLPATADIFDI